MAAYAALVSLMNNIQQIQCHTRLPIHFDQEQSEFLLEKVNFLIDFLESYNYGGAGEEMKDLESRIRDAAYAAEDIIETHVVDTIDTIREMEENEIKYLESRSSEDHRSSGGGKNKIRNYLSFQGIRRSIKHLKKRVCQTEKNATLSDSDIEKPRIKEVMKALQEKKKVMEGMKKMKDKSALEDMQPRIPINIYTTPSSSYIPAPTLSARQTEMEPVPTISVKNPCLQGIEEIMKEMDFIKEEAMKMEDKKEIEDTRPSSPITSPFISSVFAGNGTTVGFDNELERITNRLLVRDSSRQVIPIVGMGGIGKTTLAKAAYGKFERGKHFDFCAWVTISQEYDLKKIMLGLLQSESSQMSENELGQMLHKRLYGRRYLIVLDDMWSVKAWEMVQLFLPDTNNGSRIIVTTRESSVSTCFGSSSIEMSFLDEDQSWNLFCEKVFDSKGCPLELEEVGRKIVKNCKGLPLSIVVIGGLLAKSESGKEYWEYIAQDTTTLINLADNERCMKILSLSYHNLPVHLKPCFLYLSAFSEDEEICASMLIKLWVAEGFLKSNCSKELEVLGREYLHDLVNRNLVMVVERRFDSKIRHCMMHDLVRDICLKGAENEKFMSARKFYNHDDVQSIGSQRRSSFHKSYFNDEENDSQVLDTMRSASMARTLITSEYRPAVFPLQNFRLLRVLKDIGDESSDEKEYSPNDILKLVNSRLIAISIDNDITTIIPSSLRLLWNLQILIVARNDKYVFTAPLEIWKMTELRHLQFKDGVCLPDPPPSQDVMKNLHTLKDVRDFSLSDEVVKRIPNIKKLRFSCNLEEESLKNLSLLQNLESLNLTNTNDTVSDTLPNLSFPNSLKKLCLTECRFHWEGMWIIGSLPHLEVLKLNHSAFIGPKWVLNEEVFQCLKYLEIFNCTDLVQWIAEDTHFPCLEHLHLNWLKKLEEIPSGIGDIPTLQMIELKYCCKSAVFSAKNILEEQENLGNVSLKVKVTCFSFDELESLASDNFSVDAY